MTVHQVIWEDLELELKPQVEGLRRRKMEALRAYNKFEGAILAGPPGLILTFAPRVDDGPRTSHTLSNV